MALGKIDSVVVVTRAMLQLPALRSVAAAKVHLVENGIPALQMRLADLGVSRVSEVPPGLLEFTRRRPTLVAIGRLSAEKGFGDLIAAFGRANAERATHTSCSSWGRVPGRAVLTQLIITSGLQDSVMLAGYLEGADRLLQGAAGFVMSSHTEGMPLVLLEALQWRVPILATAVGAIPELLQHARAGELVPPRDVVALARALSELMSRDPAAYRAASTGLATHSSQRMAADYLRLYRAIT